ncbi:MAG TPA: NAD(P)-dependent oxidoreductase [Roseiarcus sp.]
MNAPTSVACLLNESTRHLLNADSLRLMKPTAYLINVARGSINRRGCADRDLAGRARSRSGTRRVQG